MRLLPVCLLLLLTTLGACGHDSVAAPTTSTTTETAASPTTTETFDGVLPVGGSTFFTFDVGTYGTVNATLVLVSGAGVPSTVQVRVGLGTMADAVCAPGTTAIVSASTTVAATATDQPGTYCVSVADVGNLFANAAVELTVAHP